jgi:hypothetical protein
MGDEEPKKVCPLCNGQKWTRTSDLSVRPCLCLRRNKLRDFLGPELATAPFISETSSPLYAFDSKNVDKPASLDRTTENLFIKSRWSVLPSHFQLAIGHRYLLDPSFRFRIETDEHLLNVYLGNEHTKWKASKVRDDAKGLNSLKDVVENLDLLIVRLGLIGYKNVAAPGVLKQSLMMREFALKPTWVVQDPSNENPISWNEEVRAYLAEHFDVVDFTREKPATTVGFSFHVPKVQPVADKPAMEVEELSAEPEVRTIPSNDDDPMGITRAGTSKPGGKKKNWKRRNDSGGGGPV